MNRLVAATGLAVALATLPATAALVNVGAESVVPDTGDGASSLGYTVNSTTGHYAICYGNRIGIVSTLKCRQFDAQDQPLTPAWIATDMNSRPIDAIDVVLADDGRLYAAVVADRRGYAFGWDDAGTSLFTPVQLSTLDIWTDLDIAVTANGFWLAGTAQPTDRSTMQLHYFAYDLAGTLVHQATQPDSGFMAATECGIDLTSDIAANRSGDIALAWVQPSLYGFCLGSVMVQTFRSNFTATSTPRAINTIVRDEDTGIDDSPYFDPRVAAIDDGRFVLAWVGEAEVVSATIGATGTVLVPQTDVMPGIFPAFSANPVNGDFVVVGEGNACDLAARLAIDGDLDPVARFAVGACADDNGHRAAFERDGRLGIARARGAGITLSRVTLPAQIEIANVVVSEGDPGPGANPVARVNASLTRPHPNGEDVQVSFFTRAGTATMNRDFAQTAATAVFAGAGGATSTGIAVAILPDTEHEDDEAFTIELEQPVNAVLRHGAQRSTVVIRDDDPTPPIAVDCDGDDAFACRTVQEADADPVDIVLTLTMAQPIGVDVQIGYVTQDGTATAGSDYAAASGQVQIPAGATEAAIALRVLGDEVAEDTETFHVRLVAPADVALVARDLVVHILDDTLCHLAVAPDEIVTTQRGSTESLAVTTGDDCAWSVALTDETMDAWVTITSPTSAQGNGPILLDIAPFVPAPDEFRREGSLAITLADPLRTIVVPVIQDGDCSFTVAPDTQTFAVEGGSGTVSVDASVPQCEWGVTSPASWITVLSPLAPIAGDGTVTYRVDANADQVNVESGPRSIALASEEFSHVITQDGCTYSLDSNALAVDAAGDVSSSVAIDTQTVCRWTAVSHASWILVQDGASGTGAGTVELFVLDNPTVQPRTGTVSIGDETLVVTQGGLECDYALTPANLVACPGGRAFALDIAATDGCDWTLHSDAPWAALLAGDAGTGDGRAQGLVDVNLAELPRSATLQLRAQNIGIAATTLTQEGYLTYELFADTRPADWRYVPDAAWRVGNGDLIGNAAQATALALDQTTTCSDCELFARVAVTTASSAPGETLALLGWYRDADNHVALAMDEFSNRWTLSQIVDGTRLSADADVGDILPNTFYDLHLVFDGDSFVVELDGQVLLNMPLQGDAPFGSAGLRLTASGGRLTELRINAVEATSTPATPMHVFASGFEELEVPPPTPAPNTSQCRLADSM